MDTQRTYTTAVDLTRESPQFFSRLTRNLSHPQALDPPTTQTAWQPTPCPEEWHCHKCQSPLPIIARIGISALILTAILWLFLDLDSEEHWDYSTIPSFFGPGTFLAWLITCVDYLSERWWHLIVLLSRGLPSTAPSTIESSQTRTVQRIAIGAYPLVTALWYMFNIGVQPPTQKAGVLETMTFVSGAVYVLSLPSSGQQSGMAMGFLGSSGFSDYWSSSTHDSPYFSSFFWRLPLSVWISSTVGWSLFSRIEPLSRSRAWHQFIQSGFSHTLTNGTITLLFSIAVECLFQSRFRSRPVSFRPPWPKTRHSLAELDQAFALGLALACFIIPRFKVVVSRCRYVFQIAAVALANMLGLGPSQRRESGPAVFSYWGGPRSR